ncbi:GNAT family N-acetyltransferase [Phaeocystidibacter marisrubri]|uniref:GNAT family N-acetyltransferase n=1 Tax=Phaeocystidibacter marisrubri TaxID=1577780 RepID=A0A6L3ZF02_9FLAO|nr:GNAT family N-acetyltransferase [Phaeocystidibacter marisrubri]KAB2816411.1 GNAT family N-acetyltransferase [Phaeocystidibacter marisrubri]GGH68922.1 GNAT family acetyltransferase [Phaeocystidibacter marisrubri]
MKWTTKSWSELTKDELYDILHLRQEVFCVEQDCPYIDCDYHDQTSTHIWATDDAGIIAYTRIAPPGEIYKEVSIGRVITAMRARRIGLGKEAMEFSIAYCREHYPGPIRIMAQSYLLEFYESYGFEREGKEFLEDGLPHWEMVLGV